jgi:hypothetical protein
MSIVLTGVDILAAPQTCEQLDAAVAYASRSQLERSPSSALARHSCGGSSRSARAASQVEQRLAHRVIRYSEIEHDVVVWVRAADEGTAVRGRLYWVGVVVELAGDQRRLAGVTDAGARLAALSRPRLLPICLWPRVPCSGG